ncbi:MAG TPA: IS256 family transposase [Bdellovibrio sp.]|nr:IS256 family transposase [Bdellovibrio sp.]
MEQGSKNIIQINEELVKDQVGEVVRETVEETLNKLLDAEADQLCNAQRYQRSADRTDTRAGHYTRKLSTKAGEVELKVPKLRKITFESAIIERYKRRESSVEESLIEMYLAGVSVRRVEDITQALWGSKVSPSTVSKLNQQIYVKIDEWRNRRIEGEFAYVFMDGIVLKRTWVDEVRNVSVLVAFGVNQEGFRELLGTWEGPKEDKSGWGAFLAHLKERGLKGVRLFITDKCMGLVESLAEYYPQAFWQRCAVHFYRNIWSQVPSKKMAEVIPMLKAIHAQENRAASIRKAKEIVGRLRSLRLMEAAKILEEGYLETLSYTLFPRTHWRSLRTNNPMERMMKEIRRRTNVVGSFPDGRSALMLASARMRYMTYKDWGKRRYLNMNHLNGWEVPRKTA